MINDFWFDHHMWSLAWFYFLIIFFIFFCGHKKINKWMNFQIYWKLRPIVFVAFFNTTMNIYAFTFMWNRRHTALGKCWYLCPNLWKCLEMRRRVGTVVRMLISYQCSPGLISAQCLMWVEFLLVHVWLQGFSSGSSGFPPFTNTNISSLQFDKIEDHRQSQLRLISIGFLSKYHKYKFEICKTLCWVYRIIMHCK